MSVHKYVKFAAPFNSSTFNETTKRIIGRNGVLAGGVTTTSGDTVTIQPVTVVQEGIITDISTALSATLSGTLVAPYFVAVTISSGIENTAEVITPTFVKRPQDVSDNTILIAEWDGQEWRQLPYLDVGDNAILARNQLVVAGGLVGIATGMTSFSTGTDISVDVGTAYAADGSPVIKEHGATLPIIDSDPSFSDRIDEIVLRKPRDSDSRTAMLTYVVGPTTGSETDISLGSQQTLSSVAATTASKILNNPDTDDYYFLFVEALGGAGNLQFRVADDAFGAVAAAVPVASNVDSFDAALNPDGSIDVVYTKGANDLYYKRISAVGATVFAESVIYASTTPVVNPKIVSVTSDTTYYLHIIFEKRISVSERQLGYVRLSASNTVETEFQTIVDLSANLKNPSLDKDDDDSMIYLAFEDSGSGNAYLMTFDAGSATSSAPPDQVGDTVTLQDSVYYLQTSTILASTGATNPVVKRTDNKETYVFWRHPNGLGKYVVAIYNENYLDELGEKAFAQDMYALGEDVDSFSVAVDGLNIAHLSVLAGGLVGMVNVNLATALAGVKAEILAAAGTYSDIAFTQFGALLHTYATSTNSYAIKSTAAYAISLRDNVLPPTDVYIARYDTNSLAVYSAGTALEEDIAIRRLYEFNNMFPATGSVVWGGAADETLQIVADITINFLDRKSTYTVAANTPTGVVIPDGSVCFVTIPDEDLPFTLDLEIAEFGSGFLDRNRRRTAVLFWNVSDILYTKFAPFRVDSDGGTIVLNSGLTNNAKTWLGLPSENPDPTAHGYSSTRVIGNSDSYNTALGKLDNHAAAVNDALPLHLYASLTPDAKLNFGPSLASRPDGTGLNVTPIKHTTPSVVASTINFQTQATTGATFSITWPTSVVGKFRRLAFSLLSSGTIVGNFSAEVALVGSLADPGTLYVGSGTPLGYIDLVATATTPAFKTAGSATNIIENTTSSTPRIVNLAGSGSGSGSSSSGAALEPDPGFEAVFEDRFEVGTTDASTKVDATYTKATYDSSNSIYQLSCDKSRTVTCVGTAYTLSGSPGFTVQVGDIIWANALGAFRRIATVTTQTTGLLATAFASDPSAAACMVSQAVWTKDLTQLGDAAGTTDELPTGTLYGATDFSSVHLEYDDSLAAADPYSDRTSTALITAAVSNSGVLAASGLPAGDTFSVLTRPTFPSLFNDLALVNNATKQRMIAVFFCNPTNGTVTTTANLIRYKLSCYETSTTTNGGFLNSAWCMTDGTGTPYNCSVSTVLDGVLAINVTEITLSWGFVQGVNSGSPDGDIEVLVEGAGVYPRYFTGVIGDYWTEVTGSITKVRFNNDLSARSLSVHIRRRQGTIDTSDSNALRLTQPGVIEAYAGSTVPTGYLYCDGSAVSRSTYSGLYAAIIDAWGAGDGLTTFNIPDLRGVFLRGTGTQTISAISYSGPAIGAKQGDLFQSHYHSYTDPGHVHIETSTQDGIVGGTNVLGPGSSGNGTSTSATGNAVTAITITDPTTGAGGTVRTGSETRPANAGVKYIIKY